MRHPFEESPNNRDPWEAIAQLKKDMQFIYMVRHPVDRAYSHYAHHMRCGCTMTFENALKSNSIYLDTSRYQKQLEYFRSHMPDAPLLLVEFDEFKNDTEGSVGNIVDFLKIKNDLMDETFDTHKNGRTSEYYISSMVRKIPFFSQIRKMVPRNIWSCMRSILHASPAAQVANRRASTPPMLADTRAKLLEVFEPDIVAVERFLARSLSAWRV